MARNWAESMLHTCLADHPQCLSEKNDNFMPTRVIDVGSLHDAQKPRLIIPAASRIRGKYMTLSYCWGGRYDAMLTSATLNDYQSVIPVDSLPKTLRDAIHITQWFGIRFLWIDSLCILQDSVADWEYEAKTMSEVYRYSHLTIAALMAERSDLGCLALRNPLVHQPCWLFKRDGADIFIHPHSEDGTRSSETFYHSSLRKRGWVLQERMLSRRILYFGDQLFWECGKEMRADLCPFSSTSQLRSLQRLSIKRLLSPLQMSTSTASHKWQNQPSLLEQVETLWKRITLDYTTANLTVKSDRLLAITGIINYIQQCTGFRNLAGLWQPFLLQQLLWETGRKNYALLNGRAPSWSWIGVDIQVFNRITLPLEFEIDEKKGDDSIWLAKVAHAEATPQRPSLENDRAFRLDGQVHLLCPSFEIEKVSRHLDSDKQLPGEDIIISNGFPPLECAYLDFDRVPDERDALTFLPIVKVEHSSSSSLSPLTKWECIGLVVRPSTSFQGAYERVGLLRSYLSHGSDICAAHNTSKLVILI
jgi:Heterokaryon incompatibility protein (HET)